jgi:hypothetical protein
MAEDKTIGTPQTRPLALAALALTGVLACALLGAVANAVNGYVSPLYFKTILGWGDVEDLWRASIAQGVLEGLLFGVALSLLYTTIVGLVTGASCSYEFGLKHLLAILLGALVAWSLGGLAAVALASLSPEFYRRAFYGVPAEASAMRRYAWVGGSMWGVELGGLVSVILGLVVLRANWRRRYRN